MEPVPPLGLNVTVYVVGADAPPPPPPPPPEGIVVVVVVVVGGLGAGGGTTVVAVSTVTAFEGDDTGPAPCSLIASTVKR
jgi:hypothetical protein